MSKNKKSLKKKDNKKSLKKSNDKEKLKKILKEKKIKKVLVKDDEKQEVQEKKIEKDEPVFLNKESNSLLELIESSRYPFLERVARDFSSPFFVNTLKESFDDSLGDWKGFSYISSPEKDQEKKYASYSKINDINFSDRNKARKFDEIDTREYFSEKDFDNKSFSMERTFEPERRDFERARIKHDFEKKESHYKVDKMKGA